MTKKTYLDKSLKFMSDFNDYMFSHSKFMDSLPPKIILFFEDAKDPAFTQANLKAARAHRAHTRGFKQVIASKRGSRWTVRPLAEVRA
jgi:uncharacterized protein DUF5647